MVVHFDAMNGAGQLTIDARAEEVGTDGPAGLSPGHYVHLGVRDSGEGMDAGTLARAAEPFFSIKGIGRGPGWAVDGPRPRGAARGGPVDRQRDLARAIGEAVKDVRPG